MTAISAITAATAMNRAPENLVAQATLPSPLGPLTAAATARGLALLWFDAPELGAVPVDAAHNARNCRARLLIHARHCIHLTRRRSHVA